MTNEHRILYRGNWHNAHQEMIFLEFKPFVMTEDGSLEMTEENIDRKILAAAWLEESCQVICLLGQEDDLDGQPLTPPRELE